MYEIWIVRLDAQGFRVDSIWGSQETKESAEYQVWSLADEGVTAYVVPPILSADAP